MDKSESNPGGRRALRSLRPGADPLPGTFDELVRLSKQADVQQNERLLTTLQGLTTAKQPFTVGDGLQGVPEAILICSQYLITQPEDFVPQLISLLEMCALPLQSVSIQDDAKLDASLISVLDSVSTALSIPHAAVRITACNTLRRVARYVRETCFDDVIPPPMQLTEKRKTMHLGLPHGLFAKRLVDSMGSAKGKVVMEEMLGVKVLLELSHYRAMCKVMTSCNVHTVIADIFNRCPWSDRRVITCTEVLWNIMDITPEACNVVCQDGNLLTALKHQFELSLLTGYKVRDKEARNDILMVLTHLAMSPSNAARFLSEGLTALLVTVSCGAELNVESAVLKPFVLTMGEEDFQMKKMLWHLLFLLAHDEANLKLILDLQVLPVLLSYIDVNCTTSSVIRWPTLQLVDLQTQVLGILCHLCVAGQKQFLEASGPTTVLAFLENCVDLDAGLRAMTLRVMCNISTTPNRMVISNSNVLPTILHVLSDVTSSIEVKSDCFQIISDVVFRDKEGQEAFREQGGVSALVPYLSYEIGIRSPAVESLVAAACDCVWNCVAGSEEAEIEFLDLDGVFATLHVLDNTTDLAAQLPILGTISDLLKYVEARKEFKQWRSKKDSHLSAMQMLLKLWCMEGVPVVNPAACGFEAIGTKVDLQGCYVEGETVGPTYCTLVYGGCVDDGSHHGLPPLPVDIATIATTASRRLKIWCILEQVGWDGHIELFPQEKKVAIVVRAYAELCRDGLWCAIDAAITRDGITMIPQDEIKMKEVLSSAKSRAEQLYATQVDITNAEQRWYAEQETTFYKSLIKHTEKVTKATHMGMSITEAKIKKAQMLKASFKAALASKGEAETTHGELVDDTLASEIVSPSEETASPLIEQSKALVRAPAKLGATDGQQFLSALEYDVFVTINSLRTQPTSFLPHLEECLTHFTGNTIQAPGGDVGELTVDGTAAYDAAIQFLKSVKPVKALLDAPMGMSLACNDHVMDLSARPEVTHDGSDGSSPMDRLKRYGVASGRHAQSIALGKDTAMGIVVQLLVCDGVQSLVDRTHLFNEAHAYLGVSCGTHMVHQSACVIKFCVDYTNKSRDEQTRTHVAILAAL